MYRSCGLILSFVVLSSSTDNSTIDWATQQLPLFKANHAGPVANMTVSNGAPVYKNDTSVLNRNLILKPYVMESLQHVVRELTPGRRVHDKGSGAFGYFEVTHNISNICKAKVFSEDGKKTRVAVRFSAATSIQDISDTVRNAKGFSVKFYTEEGILDIPGLNLPMFPFKNSALFTAFVHCQNKNPVSNVLDPNMLWDFICTNPESIHAFLWLFGDQGTPYCYTNMKGHSIHTHQVYNEKGEISFMRFHFIPDGGIINLNAANATILAGEDPDYYGRKLFNMIASGNCPSWTVYMQPFTLNQATNNTKTIDSLFDVTKILPENEYNLVEIGKLVLNENPTNYFADVAQMAFCPANLVPGMLGAPDKIYEARRFSYRDAQNYRLGPNFNKITA